MSISGGLPPVGPNSDAATYGTSAFATFASLPSLNFFSTSLTESVPPSFRAASIESGWYAILRSSGYRSTVTS